ncbi:hypothetical protein CR513_43608, partial [Mucuna pruriens]
MIGLPTSSCSSIEDRRSPSSLSHQRIFQEIFPKDILCGLPPIRGIEHQIDSTMGATLPNNAAYKANLEESTSFPIWTVSCIMLLLRCFVGGNLKTWEVWVPHIEFACNKVVNETTSHTHFKLVYGYNPLSPLDLVSLHVPSKTISKGLSKVQSMVRLHEIAMTFIERQGKKYVERVNSDRKGKFLQKFELLPQGARPFLVLKRINDNAYILDMSQEYGGSCTFNVLELSLFDA